MVLCQIGMVGNFYRHASLGTNFVFNARFVNVLVNVPKFAYLCCCWWNYADCINWAKWQINKRHWPLIGCPLLNAIMLKYNKIFLRLHAHGSMHRRIEQQNCKKNSSWRSKDDMDAINCQFETSLSMTACSGWMFRFILPAKVLC